MLFDFFGTLTTAIQRGPAHAAIAESLGCDSGRFAAALDRTFSTRAAGRCGSPAETLRRLAAEQGAFPTDARLAAAVAARVDAVAADVTLRPEAVPVLRAVRQMGLSVALVSDCWYELPAFFPQLPVAPFVDQRIYSVDVGRCKPDQRIYQAATTQLGVAPQRCLYIGDGGGRELSGARCAGMTAVQLVADDLAGHLVFDLERAWDGRSVRDLTEVLPLLSATVRADCGDRRTLRCYG